MLSGRPDVVAVGDDDGGAGIEETVGKVLTLVGRGKRHRATDGHDDRVGLPGELGHEVKDIAVAEMADHHAVAGHALDSGVDVRLATVGCPNVPEMVLDRMRRAVTSCSEEISALGRIGSGESLLSGLSA
jgi:hypothetical protein